MFVSLRAAGWKMALVVLVGGGLAAGVAAASSASEGTATPPPVDHQLCYVASGAPFKIPAGVRLVDRFSPGGFVPIIGSRLLWHCNPVQKTLRSGLTFPITNPNAHLGCFSITAPSKQPAPAVLVANQFGSATLAPSQPNLLCLPSWKSLTGPPGKSHTTPPGLSHFTCYPVAVLSGAYRPPAVLLQDEFAKKPVIATVNPRPTELCLVTKKIVGTGAFQIVNPAEQLLCFPVSQTPVIPTVWDENQFGTSKLSVKATKWLCAPSTLAGHLYWSTYGGTVVEANPDGSDAKTIATGQDGALGVAVDGSHLYWASTGGGTIVEANLDGSNPQTIATGQNAPVGVAGDASHLYWADNAGENPGTIVEANLNGSNPKTIATGQANPTGVAVNSSHLYWSNGTGGTIVEANLDGSNAKTIAKGIAGPWGVAVNASHLYWASEGAGTIVEANLDGSNPKTIATGQSNPTGVAVNSSHLYWAQMGNKGAIVEANLDGSNAKTIATDPNDPAGIAVSP